MRIKFIFSALGLAFLMATVYAQNVIPTGYTMGAITLANGNVLQGPIKNNMKKSATVIYVDAQGKNKKMYDASEISKLSIDTVNFICIRGDFFKIICGGKLNFLQKASNLSNKISYNGTEPLLNNGTAGKIGDFFIYRDNELKLMNKKNIEFFINTELTGYGDAIQKAEAINGDIAKLENAVENYNIYNK